MAKKTARQLDREIAAALSGEHLPTQVRRPWWIWQLVGAARVLKKVELPWSYTWKNETAGEAFSREDLWDIGFKDVSKLRVVPRRLGAMLTIVVTKSGLRQMLTPPLYLFANLKKIDPDVNLTDIGSFRFWIQPEVFQATRGEIYQGDNVRDLLDVDRDALVAAPEQGAVNEVLVALDAYLANDRADPRFV